MNDLEAGAEPEVIDDPNRAEPINEPTSSPAADPAPKEPAPTEDNTDKGDDTGAKADWPEDWRDRMSGGDDDISKLLSRYGSPKGVAKALREARSLISSGKVKRDMPDPSDEKAVAEWRKEQGIPDDPTGYALPETVTKRLTDEDKPILASFTEFAHAKGAPQQVVDIASEWYFEMAENMAAQQSQADNQASETCEEILRKDWPQGEYKANLTLGKRFAESVPGTEGQWLEARLPDGRRLGDIPEVVMWASDMGRNQYGDATFANSDAERKHTARKEEIEQVMKSNIDEYYEKGLDKEYNQILERESKRRK